MSLVYHSDSHWKNRIEDFMEHPWIQNLLVFLILLNAVILGLETDHDIMAKFGTELILIDHAILWVFIAEIVVLITARGIAYFKDPWCVFDFIVVGIALI